MQLVRLDWQVMLANVHLVEELLALVPNHQPCFVCEVMERAAFQCLQLDQPGHTTALVATRIVDLHSRWNFCGSYKISATKRYKKGQTPDPMAKHRSAGKPSLVKRSDQVTQRFLPMLGLASLLDPRRRRRRTTTTTTETTKTTSDDGDVGKN